MAKAKPGSIEEQMRGFLPSNRRALWEDSLPDDVRAELEGIKANWHAGKYSGIATKTGLAQAVSKTLEARGLPGCAHTVARWLDRK